MYVTYVHGTKTEILPIASVAYINCHKGFISRFRAICTKPLLVHYNINRSDLKKKLETAFLKYLNLSERQIF